MEQVKESLDLEKQLDQELQELSRNQSKKLKRGELEASLKDLGKELLDLL